MKFSTLAITTAAAAFSTTHAADKLEDSPTTATENGRKLAHIGRFFFHFEECILYNNNTLVTGLGPDATADWDPVLSSGEPLTVFAPTDEAFVALPPALIPCLMLPENNEVLQSVLNYHIANGNVASSDLTDGQVIPTLLDGQDVTVKIMGDGTVMINDAHVVIPDVDTTNGVVHAIDAVLVPPSVDVTAFLATCPAVDADASTDTDDLAVTEPTASDGIVDDSGSSVATATTVAATIGAVVVAALL